jgi:hypothetical protein
MYLARCRLHGPVRFESIDSVRRYLWSKAIPGDHVQHIYVESDDPTEVNVVLFVSHHARSAAETIIPALLNRATGAGSPIEKWYVDECTVEATESAIDETELRRQGLADRVLPRQDPDSHTPW